MHLSKFSLCHFLGDHRLKKFFMLCVCPYCEFLKSVLDGCCGCGVCWWCVSHIVSMKLDIGDVFGKSVFVSWISLRQFLGSIDWRSKWPLQNHVRVTSKLSHMFILVILWHWKATLGPMAILRGSFRLKNGHFSKGLETQNKAWFCDIIPPGCQIVPVTRENVQLGP